MTEIVKYNVKEDTPESLKEFVESVKERLNSEDLDCTVEIETVVKKELDELPAEQLPKAYDTVEEDDYGVRVYSEFEENSDAPTRIVSEVAREKYGKNFEKCGSFRGGEGYYDTLVFPEIE